MIAFLGALLLLCGASDEHLPDGEQIVLRADPAIVSVWLGADGSGSVDVLVVATPSSDG